MRIDAHQHFWKYSPKEYAWIGDNMAHIRRDFLPADLEREMGAVGMDAVVAVQARTSLDETQWLVELAGKHAFIRGVVGWVPLCDSSLDDHLAGLAGKICGVREVCQGQPEGFMLRPGFVSGVRRLAGFGMAYDILIFESQLKEATHLVDLCPNQTFVLDHLAKPPIGSGKIDVWKESFRELSKRENVYCKVSGMVTEADFQNWKKEHLRPCFEAALEMFGPRRLMFGSDWPVCLVAADYARWFGVMEEFVAALSTAEQAEIFGGTAMRAYRLS